MTAFEPIPAGEYTALIDDVNPRQVTYRAGFHRTILDVIFNLQDPELKARLSQEVLSVHHGIFIDMTPDGAVDMSKGKNIELNKLCDALGINTPGQNFSLNQLKGAEPLKVQIEFGPADQMSDVFFHRVKSFGKM
jgi:hypothetical protein